MSTFKAMTPKEYSALGLAEMGLYNNRVTYANARRRALAACAAMTPADFLDDVRALLPDNPTPRDWAWSATDVADDAERLAQEVDRLQAIFDDPCDGRVTQAWS